MDLLAFFPDGPTKHAQVNFISEYLQYCSWAPGMGIEDQELSMKLPASAGSFDVYLNYGSDFLGQYDGAGFPGNPFSDLFGIYVQPVPYSDDGDQIIDSYSISGPTAEGGTTWCSYSYKLTFNYKANHTGQTRKSMIGIHKSSTYLSKWIMLSQVSD